MEGVKRKKAKQRKDLIIFQFPKAKIYISNRYEYFIFPSVNMTGTGTC